MTQKPDVLIALAYAAIVVFLASSCDGPRAALPGVTPSALPSVTPAVDPTKPVAPLLERTVTSPAGRWNAYSLASAPVVSATSPTGMAYQAVLRLTGPGGQTWTPVDEWRPSGLGWTWPDVLQWSGDEQAVYFTNVPVPDGCAPFANGSDLWRLDLASGEVIQLAPELGMSLALSPDERTLAYIAAGGAPELVLRDLASGDERRARIADAGQYAGDIRWAADGTALDVRIAKDPCADPDTFTTVRVDAQTLTVP